MTIPNKPECLSRPPGAECGNTDKGKSGGVGGGIQQQQYHGIKGRRGMVQSVRGKNVPTAKCKGF